jgi:hypothetical protein
MTILTNNKGPKMKPKTELQEDAGLVRDIEAACGVDYPADDYVRGLRDGLFRKAYAEINKLELNHVRRINEAVCAMKFPTEAALGLQRATLTRLAEHHQLKKYRAVKMPSITVPQPAGK